ncbi:MAG TPA: hypothetical protein VHT96_07125 [Clostridia bacterium]|nr:hypothetical protein [Clostridia bacterium]
MKITDEARELIREALASNNCDCLQVVLQESCCGTSLSLGLSKLEPGDATTDINGISVIMDEQTQARAESVLLAVEDGELVMHDNKPSSSCCC